jgi:hypothetical protein
VLVPVYALLRLIPASRESAQRLGLVTLAAMVAALVQASRDAAQWRRAHRRGAGDQGRRAVIFQLARL